MEPTPQNNRVSFKQISDEGVRVCVYCGKAAELLAKYIETNGKEITKYVCRTDAGKV